ncbi:contactin [Cloeon dipterum]|uniref:contactin n=1 Tax=Cloeon dipterum TaxID=197152 RepID=UPI00321F9F2D
MRTAVWLLVALGTLVSGQRSETERERELELRCPKHWIQFRSSCYRFIKSPNRPRVQARQNCQVYDADLVSVDTLDEHTFVMQQLQWQDPQHRTWYTSGRQQSPGYWVNEGDNSQLTNMDAAFFPDYDNTPGRDFLAYGYDQKTQKWGFKKVRGDEYFLFICEAPVRSLHHVMFDDRTHEYGLEVKDPEKVPRGPYFVKQPVNVDYDASGQRTQKYVTLTCVAKGYPNPTYEWFKEVYESDRVVAKKIDPLKDGRYTISGGSLIIYEPKQIEDNGQYHCRASNKFGNIVSESVLLSFAFVGEFNLKRSAERGQQNWGKAIHCDPPQHYPSITYSWARDYFPNLVEEDRRVFVSYDGNLYFSSLENIDKGNYTCSVKNSVSKTGRNGPIFHLDVIPHSNSQQLKFGNNFPQAFPQAPVAGQEVRLECVAFGYPVVSYNWTRKGSNLPRGAIVSNYNRVLTIPRVTVEDQGEYVCRIYNDKQSMTNSVMLTIRAEPNFTIPLVDKHIDKGSDLTWTCEAFGIPDVAYSWYKNGMLLDPYNISIEDRERIIIVDNVLTIKALSAEMDDGMYQCQATNQLKTRFSSAQLRVLSLKPSFRKHPLEAETYAHEGGNVTIKCNPEAAPMPKFTWKKENNVLGSSGTRRILENGNLVITRVSREDAGVYTCIARNVHGSDESRGRLVVMRGPSFVREPKKRIVASYGSNIYLECSAYSEEILDLAFTWNMNGLSLKDKYRENSTVTLDGGRLKIENSTFADAGTYECIVESTVGFISAKTEVIIDGPPGPPGAVDAKPVARSSPRSVVISWADGAKHGRDITYFQITGRTKWNSTWLILAENVTANKFFLQKRREYEVTDVLSPWSVYEFRVAAGNSLGLGIPSAPSPFFNTQPDKPYVAPVNIGGGGGKIGDLTITWDPLSEGEQNGPGIFYKVYWKRVGSNSEFQSQELRHHGNIGRQVVKVQYEFYYTEFEVKVQSGNSIGFGPISEPVIIYSAEDMPQVSPSQVSALSFNSTALNVSWVPIEMTRDKIRGKLIGHRLKYWKKDGREEDAVYYLSRSTKPWALIVGLQPNEYYYVKCMAYNTAGEGPESERYIERTFRKAPQKAPTAVHVHPVDPSTIRVVWRYVAPAPDEEPIIGYKIRIWDIDHDFSTANDTLVQIGSKLEAYLYDLTPGKAYSLRVLAYSNGGDGRMSSPAIKFQMGDKELRRSNEAPALTTHPLLLIFSVFVVHQALLRHQINIP